MLTKLNSLKNKIVILLFKNSFFFFYYRYMYIDIYKHAHYIFCVHLRSILLQYVPEYCSVAAILPQHSCWNCFAAILQQYALQQYCCNQLQEMPCSKYCRKSNLHTKNDITAILLQHIARMLLQYCGNIAGRCCQKVNILVRVDIRMIEALHFVSYLSIIGVI